MAAAVFPEAVGPRTMMTVFCRGLISIEIKGLVRRRRTKLHLFFAFTSFLFQVHIFSFFIFFCKSFSYLRKIIFLFYICKLLTKEALGSILAGRNAFHSYSGGIGYP